MRLGVIGGLGPMATAYFMELIIKMTKAECDQDHVDMVVYNCPSIPDRTGYILGKSSQSPLPRMIELGKRLADQGVSHVAIPCMTAHYFHSEIQEGVGDDVTIIHGIRETAAMLKAAGVQRVGIMATDGTVASGIFQKEIENLGMEAVLPDEENQRLVMSLIYDDVKKGKEPDMHHFKAIKRHLALEGRSEVIVLGCTELSVIKRDYEIGAGFIDAMEVLAKVSVLSAGKEVKAEYETLFHTF